MSFYNFNVDLQSYSDGTKIQPIVVIANFTKDGKIRPEIIRYALPDESYVQVKVDQIKYYRDNSGHLVFCCLFTNYGRQYEILLTYHIKDHCWTMQI